MNSIRVHKWVFGATLALFVALTVGGVLRVILVDHRVPHPTDSYFMHLDKLISNEEYERAERELRVAIALDFIIPNQLAFYHDLGTVHLAQGELDDALAAYHRARLMLPAESLRGKARVYERKGDTETALQHLRKALTLEPDDVALRCYAGELLGKTQRFPESEAQFRKALELEPDSAVALVGLGNALGAQNRLDEAIGHFERALEIDGESALAHQYMSMALPARGRLDDAIQHAERWSELEPDSAASHLHLARLLEQRGEPEAAALQRERAQQLSVEEPGG